jgi:hypothetical protein
LQVPGETFYLGKIDRSTCQLLVTQQTGFTAFLRGHGIHVSVMDFPVPVANLTVNRLMTAVLPVIKLHLVTFTAKVRTLIHQWNIHLFSNVITSIVPVLTERFRNETRSHYNENDDYQSDNA